jgi:hypothetical protein
MLRVHCCVIRQLGRCGSERHPEPATDVLRRLGLVQQRHREVVERDAAAAVLVGQEPVEGGAIRPGPLAGAGLT